MKQIWKARHTKETSNLAAFQSKVEGFFLIIKIYLTWLQLTFKNMEYFKYIVYYNVVLY